MTEIKTIASNNNNSVENSTAEPKIAGSEKKKLAFYVTDEMRKAIDENYKSDNCSSRTEFIEKAVSFYLGYLSAGKNVRFLAPVLAEIMSAIAKNSEDRTNKNLFKIAVEQGKLAHIVAAANNVDDETLYELHKMCLDEVSRIKGTISFESAVEFQRED